MAPAAIAPLLPVPEREVVALEHPMIIQNLENGLRTIGTPADQLMFPLTYEEGATLYLRPEDRTSAPIISHNVATSNVLLKITVPKRTGRKRKRGSMETYSDGRDQAVESSDVSCISSQSRHDHPSRLLRMLQDNVGRYSVEPVGTIAQTHRFRGLAEFHYSTVNAPFMSKIRDTIVTGEYTKIKKFRLDPSQGPKPLDEVVPPPKFTDHNIPFNWAYKQNGQISVAVDPRTGEKVLTNSSQAKKIHTQYVAANVEEVPLGPVKPPNLADSSTASMIAALTEALNERPCWSRRALSNRLGKVDGQYLFKECLQYVGYQFRGGPWRDALIKYGVDPRKDPKYRCYQTIFFKVVSPEDRKPGAPWQDARSEYTRRTMSKLEDETHIFDGKRLHLDGKFWQICDITDTICLRILATDKLRDKVELVSDGWYCNGTMAKLRGVMRTKITAIRAGKILEDEAFLETLTYPDVVVQKKYMNVPLPDVKDKDGGPAAHNKSFLKNPELSGLRSGSVDPRADEAMAEVDSGSSDEGAEDSGEDADEDMDD